MTKNCLVGSLVLVTLLAGCQSIPEDKRSAVHARAMEDARSAPLEKPRAVSVVNAPYIRAEETPYRDARAAVTIRVSDVPFTNVMQGLARSHGYSLMIAENVDRNRRVSVDIDRATADDALRTVAAMAGYVAIIDRLHKSVTLADTATATYKIPTNLLQNLVTRFTVGANPVTAGNPVQSPGNSALIPAGGAVKSDFTISGQQQNDADSIRAFIRQVAGRNAEVQFIPQLGLIHVHANAQALNRVHDFLTQFCRDAMAQVEIQASIVEVNLGENMQDGIDWSRLFGEALGISMLPPAAAGTATLVTSASTPSVIKALKTLTDVNIVTQPHVLAMNHSPSILFDGTQVPYVGSLTSTLANANNPASTVSAQASYAVDGISLSIQPDILDQDDVQITVVPVLSNIPGFSDFKVGDNQIHAPNQQVRQSYMKVLAKNGQTIIIGGLRYSAKTHTTKGAPGMMDMPLVGSLTSTTTKDETEKEMIVLMSTNIIPAPRYDPLIGESI
jgi:MSHA biogenesis protein MshL